MTIIESCKKNQEHVEAPLVYVTGSLFLYQCFKYLTSMGENEGLHFVTGIKLGRIMTLDYMQKVVIKSQSQVHAEADLNSLFQHLIFADERFGHYFHAYFHSHPGNNSHPSGFDMDYQIRLEAGGYKTIGGIFTRDGQMRFFSHKLPFIIEIYGKGVEQIDDTLFRFTEACFPESKARSKDTSDGSTGNGQAEQNNGLQPGNG